VDAGNPVETLSVAGFPRSSRFGSLFQGESHFERPVQFLNLGASQRPNEAGQLHLAETYEVVAQDPAFMFQAFVDTHRDLGRKSVSASEDRCANDGRKSGIEQDLAADDNEAAVKLGIVAGGIFSRTMNAIDFASSHGYILAVGFYRWLLSLVLIS
jgi:hypothetical protein